MWLLRRRAEKDSIGCGLATCLVLVAGRDGSLVLVRGRSGAVSNPRRVRVRSQQARLLSLPRNPHHALARSSAPRRRRRQMVASERESRERGGRRLQRDERRPPRNVAALSWKKNAARIQKRSAAPWIHLQTPPRPRCLTQTERLPLPFSNRHTDTAQHGPHQADCSQEHGRQGPAQAARHQGAQYDQDGYLA